MGAPTSPILSNLVCIPLDHELLNYAADQNWKYTRYADDLTFSSAEEIGKEHLAVIQQKLAGYDLAVNLDKDRKLADKFLKAVDVNFKIAFDQSGKTASSYKLRGMPSSYLIDRDGKVHASHVGFRDKDKSELEQAIKGLLNK